MVSNDEAQLPPPPYPFAEPSPPQYAGNSSSSTTTTSYPVEKQSLPIPGMHLFLETTFTTEKREMYIISDDDKSKRLYWVVFSSVSAARMKVFKKMSDKDDIGKLIGRIIFKYVLLFSSTRSSK